MTLTVNNKNQVATPVFSYDMAGNVTSDGSVSMTYDAEGRMITASGSGYSDTYTYDGDGRRVKKSDGTLYWVDDSFRPLSTGTTSSVSKDYVYLGEKRIAFVALASGNPYYYLSDNLGSTAVIASGDGKRIEWEADYYPFGAQRQVFTSSVNNPYQFTGYEYDADTQFNYAIARFDAERWGRFQAPDPYLGSMDPTNPQSMNRYSYALNGPLTFVDPTGLLVLAKPADPPQPPPAPFDICALPGFCSDPGVSRGGGGGDVSGGGGGATNLPCLAGAGPLFPGQSRCVPTIKCSGSARVLQGNSATIGKPGGFSGPSVGNFPVTTNGAAVIPSQWGPSKAFLRPFINQISGVFPKVNYSFTGIVDVMGGAPPPGFPPGSNVQTDLMQLNPGKLILELPGAPQVFGTTAVTITAPSAVGCPTGTVQVP